jgi:hypothetical protein
MTIARFLLCRPEKMIAGDPEAKRNFVSLTAVSHVKYRVEGETSIREILIYKNQAR